MKLFLALWDQYITFHDNRSKIINDYNDKVVLKRDKYYEKVQNQLYRDNSCLRREWEGAMAETNEEMKEECHENATEKDTITSKHHQMIVEKLPQEYAFVYRKEGIYAGFPVYKKRNEWIVYAIGAVILHGWVSAFLNPDINLLTAVLSAIIMLIIADFQTGFLHIILDNPISFNLPVLSQPCLEFLWHHINPTDVGDRYCVDIFGDLNVIMIIIVCMLSSWRIYTGDSLYELIQSFQLFYVYFAIYSHHISHSIRRNRGFFAKMAYRHHKVHHLGDHDEHFCLIGIGDFFVGPLTKILPKLIGDKLSYATYVCGMIGLLFIHPLLCQTIHLIDGVSR
jgi:hypothetical protein